jgi:hypothetical protein
LTDILFTGKASCCWSDDSAENHPNFNNDKPFRFSFADELRYITLGEGLEAGRWRTEDGTLIDHLRADRAGFLAGIEVALDIPRDLGWQPTPYPRTFLLRSDPAPPYF